MRIRTQVLLLLLAFGAAPPLAAAERELRLDPATTTVHFRVKARAHQVLGTLPLESGVLRFDTDTGEASGEIVMDPLRAQTGVQRRDRTMREVVFEVVRFPRVVFRPERVTGEVPTEGQGELQLSGTVAIHGTEHPITLPVKLQNGPDGIRATTTFEVPYVAWGMRNPGNALLNVDDTVEVKIETAGRLE